MHDNPVAGLSKVDALAWLREPPSRLEMYVQLTALNTVASHMVNATTSIMADNRKDAVEHLQQAFERLQATIETLPALDDDVVEALRLEVGIDA